MVLVETSPGPVAVRAGHWLILKPTATAAVSGDGFLRASVAARLDRKMDDGAPNGGVCPRCWGNGGKWMLYLLRNIMRGQMLRRARFISVFRN